MRFYHTQKPVIKHCVHCVPGSMLRTKNRQWRHQIQKSPCYSRLFYRLVSPFKRSENATIKSTWGTRAIGCRRNLMSRILVYLAHKNSGLDAQHYINLVCSKLVTPAVQQYEQETFTKVKSYLLAGQWWCSL